jgi:hypothetical protein
MGLVTQVPFLLGEHRGKHTILSAEIAEKKYYLAYKLGWRMVGNFW